MGEETRALLRRLQAEITTTLDRLIDLDSGDLGAACSHPCAHGPNGTTSIWHLIANDIDHEKMHAGQILSNRHDLGLMQAPVARLLAEWLTERAALAGTLIGMSDEDLDRRAKEGEWSFRQIVEHTIYWERDSIDAALREQTTGEHWNPQPGTVFGGPVPVRQ